MERWVRLASRVHTVALSETRRDDDDAERGRPQEDVGGARDARGIVRPRDQQPLEIDPAAASAGG